MNTETTLDDGSRVMTNGDVVMKNGTNRTLRDGESIDMNGRWTNKMGEDISDQDRNDMRNTNNDMLNNRKKNNATNNNHRNDSNMR